MTMKFSNQHLQKAADGKKHESITGRKGVDFFLAQRDDDIARWDPEKASMVFVSDEAIINCKMIQVDLTTTQKEILAQFSSTEETGE